MGKLSKTLTILGGSILAGVAYSLWKDKKDLEEENEELYDEISLLKGKNIEKDLEDGIMVSEDEPLEEDIF
ncbi:hypothetical protein CJ209_08570 [Fusobacterium nucleatum]|uniref:Uncharacterized protein n=2 Tax=Fusobacterium TaxID=848 RepID=A0A2N6THG2_FUSNU|nr:MULTISPECIES: hypothetical protein [Fusobacterium]EGN64001.1 hypothetical protein HMPREF0404_01526 [Fusobacterium animalis 21_1A]ERT37193.1 hypothetical protein HMPREF1540_00624 [Fusobacterium nucleatum CTI-3]MCL4584796.1 hypothetical protein [Fusobacterium nucleatum YWH7055]OFQ61543.1 hypothetical protein HMPREF2931_03175 [Fusobacterium sp. HMSC065F01]PMC68743.1 hypothetical protein CJ209_08570 [Fusobacterium nucleatum]